GIVLSDMDRQVQHGATMETVYGNRTTGQNTQLYSLTYTKQDFLTKGLSVSLFSSYSVLNRSVVDTMPYIYTWHGNRIDLNGDGVWDKWSSGAEQGAPTLQTSLEKNLSNRLNVAYAITKNHKIN